MKRRLGKIEVDLARRSQNEWSLESIGSMESSRVTLITEQMAV